MEKSLRGAAVQESTEIPRNEIGFEFMLNALRLNQGFEVNLFKDRTGLLLSSLEKPLLIAENKGLIERDHKIIRPTSLGRRFLNDLQQLFLENE